MPLLNKTEHTAQRLPAGKALKPNEEVFVLHVTGETVRSYEEYITKYNQYAAPIWQDKYYGKTGLTYAEALAYERDVEKNIQAQVIMKR
jgi:hypothetical protein